MNLTVSLFILVYFNVSVIKALLLIKTRSNLFHELGDQCNNVSSSMVQLGGEPEPGFLATGTKLGEQFSWLF